MNLVFFDFLIPTALIISLFLSWRNINARFMILCFIFVEAINFLSLSWALTMPIGYYVWSMAMSGVFLVFVLGRRFWAYKLRAFTFFNDAYVNHTYTIQETALVLLFTLSILNNFITFAEVYLYFIDLISNAYYKLHIRDFVQNVIFVIAAFVCVSFGLKSSKKDLKIS